MKITLLLTILGVSANTASAAYEVPEFMKSLRGGVFLQAACDCRNSNDCSGDQDCDCTANCNTKGNNGGRCKDNVPSDKANTCPGGGGGNRLVCNCNNNNQCGNGEFCDNVSCDSNGNRTGGRCRSESSSGDECINDNDCDSGECSSIIAFDFIRIL